MFYVYMILNLINGKIYIGQSKNKYRWQEHLYISTKPKYKKHQLIHKAIAKYGAKNFDFKIIQSFNSKKDCLDCEKYWIEFYKTNVKSYPNELGYNLSPGGEGNGGKWTDISKTKLSKSVSGENNSRSKLTNQIVMDIKTLLINGNLPTEICNKFLISRKALSEIKKMVLGGAQLYQIVHKKILIN